MKTRPAYIIVLCVGSLAPVRVKGTRKHHEIRGAIREMGTLSAPAEGSFYDIRPA